MNEQQFYTSTEVRPLYPEIIPVYQRAFAGEPWFEVSACEDEQTRCVGGFSRQQQGESCLTCQQTLMRSAYPAAELEARFDSFATDRPAVWYLERFNCQLSLAAVAWKATVPAIVAERYADVPAMGAWLPETLGETQEITWLDEVFADRTVKPGGNLQNFGAMVLGIARRLETPLVAYRTIASQMTKAALRDFDTSARVFQRQKDVPDRRDLVIINTAGGSL